MTVLSEKTIRERFDSLITGGNSSRIGPSVYYFVTGKIFPSGLDAQGNVQSPVDWTSKAVADWAGETAYVVSPGTLVSLRTRELVKMPNDLCGLWYQTNQLSRQGLLLVNMSIVPPGYEGPLTCTFVNFGKVNLAIKPETAVAKLLFLPLNVASGRPSRPTDERVYDGRLADMARESPTTFLQLSDRTKDLAARIDTEMANLTNVIADGAEEARQELSKVTSQASAEFARNAKDAKDQFRESVTNDTKGAVIRAAPWAAAAILIVAAVQWLSAKLLTENVEKVGKERADQIETRINQQLDALGRKPVFVYTGSAEAKELADRINSLEDEVKQLQQSKK